MLVEDFQSKIAAFMTAAGQRVATSPELLDEYTANLRIRLCREELSELNTSAYEGCIVCIADAIADLLYVVIGTGNSCGMIIHAQDKPRPALEPRLPSDDAIIQKHIRGLFYVLSRLEIALFETNHAEIMVTLSDFVSGIFDFSALLGIDIEPVFNEVHRSNMTKFIDGHRDRGGKWIKGPSYSPANLTQFFPSGHSHTKELLPTL